MSHQIGIQLVYIRLQIVAFIVGAEVPGKVEKWRGGDEDGVGVIDPGEMARF
jgi:hypothetical protein